MTDSVVLPRHQVEEAVRLVRAAAEHEKLRWEHLRRMKTLRAQLERLEGGTKRCKEAKREAAGCRLIVGLFVF